MINIISKKDGSNNLNNVEITDEEGNIIKGLRKVTININYADIVTADLEVLCSKINLCAAIGDRRIVCPFKEQDENKPDFNIIAPDIEYVCDNKSK